MLSKVTPQEKTTKAKVVQIEVLRKALRYEKNQMKDMKELLSYLDFPIRKIG